MTNVKLIFGGDSLKKVVDNECECARMILLSGSDRLQVTWTALNVAPWSRIKRPALRITVRLYEERY